MSGRQRILVAMSGGVDSSVAAARLQDAGHEVVGVTLHLWDYPEADDHHGRCCAPEDQYDARRVADALGFAHYTFDRRDLFARAIVQPFVDGYVAGETPSPCAACNRGVKLAELFSIAGRLGAELVATGHYARILRSQTGVPQLATGVDRAKDQSYFLYASPTQWLERLVFPLGDSTKQEVRAEALHRGLPGANKGESQELCFVGGRANAYADFVAERARDRIRPGPIVDEAGAVLGSHDGVHRFTIGQRRGLGVATGHPSFVTRIDASTGTVHVGGPDSLLARGAKVTALSLAEGVTLPVRAQVRVRYRHSGDAAMVLRSPGEDAHILFDAPVRAITRGQVAVFYEGERVLGGGVIAGPS